jgi:hypothetical protein
MVTMVVDCLVSGLMLRRRVHWSILDLLQEALVDLVEDWLLVLVHLEEFQVEVASLLVAL